MLKHNRRQKQIHTPQKKTQNNQTNPLYKAAKLEQLAEIEHLKQQIHIDARKSNEIYTLISILVLTPVLSHFLILREDAPFHQTYLDFIGEYFIDLPTELNAKTSQLIEKSFNTLFNVAQTECVNYYDFYEKALEDILKEVMSSTKGQYADEPEIQMIKGVVELIKEDSAIANYDENFVALIKQQLRKSNPIETVLSFLDNEENFQTAERVRSRCLNFCRMFIESLQIPDFKVKEITGFSSLDKLKLEDLFQAAKKFLLHLQQATPDVMHGFEFLREKYKLLGALEKINPFVNFNKIFMIMFGKLIFSFGANRIFPYGIRQTSIPQLKQKRLSLSEKTANNYLIELRNHAKIVKNSATYHHNLINRIYYGLAALAIVFCCLGEVPGELAFFLVAVVASMVYDSLKYAKNKWDHYQLEGQIKFAKNTLENFFDKHFTIAVNNDSSLELAQFGIKYRMLDEGICAPDMMIILNRCLVSHGIDVIAEERNQLIIPYVNISTARIATLKKEFNGYVQELKEINAAIKKLKEVQSLLGAFLARSLCAYKSFNERGWPFAMGYLVSPSQKHADALMQLIGQANSSIEQQGENKFLITIHDVTCLKNMDFSILMKSIKSDKQKNAGQSASFFPQEQENAPSSRNTPKEQSALPQAKNDDNVGEKELNKEVKSTIKLSLPSPYQNARMLNVSFIPGDSHEWILDTTKNEDYPTEECANDIKSQMVDPSLVPPKGHKGMVYDKKRSAPEVKVYKTKVLGKFGAFRAIEVEPPVKLKIGDRVETVHVISKVVLEH
jgi:hypothetical protein